MPEPVIVGASIAGGHDGAAELIVQVRFENGVVRDVAMENDTGLALMSVCGVHSIEELAGQPWQRFLEAVGQVPAKSS
ncbi:MAG: hypothetical protein NXH85_04475 [Pseudomonadaceae bacterium]|nr:hypothetical protein [Pseudomonadaceae bacterium]